VLARSSRRAVLGTLSIALATGCLDTSPENATSALNDSDDPGASETEDDPPARCDLSNRSERGRAAPIERTVDIERPEDVDVECGSIAADVALERADEKIDLDLLDPDAHWISTALRHGGDRYRPHIVVESQKTSEATGDGSYSYCPPPEYDFDELLDAVPREVTVLVDFESGSHECTHEIQLAQRQMFLD